MPVSTWEMSQLAAIILDNEIYYSQYDPLPQEPHTAATQLIQGIYEMFPDNALGILRSPLWLNYTPTLLCRSMISIAAKRFRLEPNLLDLIRFSSKQNHLISYSAEVLPRILPSASIIDALAWVQNSAGPEPSSSEEKPLFLKNRFVRAILIDSDNNLISVAENKNSKNKTKHAEILLLQNFFSTHKQGFSQPTTLITSRQCCKMCAAMYWHLHKDPWNNLKAFFVHPELGPSAKDTIFTPSGNLRREYAKDSEQQTKQVEFMFDLNHWKH